MSTEIVIRLPDAVVAFLDETVESGGAPSRAAIVVSAMEREMHRRLAARDAESLRNYNGPDDLDGLAEWSANQPLHDLD